MERWQQVEEIFHEALQRDPGQREAYLRRACGSDTALRDEIAGLLASHEDAGAGEPWAARAAAQLIEASDSPQPGQYLGPYRIESFLAAGGMGQVYLATDTRLRRNVAIKVSSARFSERFEREARVIASLNHPNICQLYDVGPNYLVMELVEGSTLADRIRQGPLPLDEALAIARQIAEALEAAHEKGRIHRDLKPANVKVTPEGLVKLLDFGLAKAAEETSATVDPSDSPTMTVSPTRAGVILGTAAYMSPEQARGSEVDKRADIWSFGCVLYEMLVGKPVFQGETTSDILASILRSEPDWSALPLATPSRIHHLLRRCLERDRKLRLRDIGEARIAIDRPGEELPPSPSVISAWPWALALAAVLLFSAVGWWRATRPEPARSLVRLNVEMPPDADVSLPTRFIPGYGGFLALSPDGTRIAFAVRSADGQRRLATRRLDQSEPTILTGTEGAAFPLFSPNGDWIAFNAELKLKKIAVQGGTPLTLCEFATAGFGGAWDEHDSIIAPVGVATALSRIPAGGCPPVPLTQLNREKNELAHRWPQLLPGGEELRFTVYFARNYDEGDIEVLSLKTGERKTVHHGGFFGRYLPSGHLVYVHQGTLFAAPFDLRRLAITGTPQPVLESVANSADGGAFFAFSQNGTAAYSVSAGAMSRPIFWMDGAGKIRPLHSDPGLYSGPRFSPDGTRLAFVAEKKQGASDIWIEDIAHASSSQLTFLPGRSENPTWTPDGRSIIFQTIRPEFNALYSILANGSADPRLLASAKERLLPYSFTPDRKRLLGSRTGPTGGIDLWSALFTDDNDHPRLGAIEPLLESFAIKLFPSVSPDGRWLAYTSNESGRSEVYVRPFPGPGGVRQVSTGGGTHAMWSHNGRELFFVAQDGRTMVVDYSTQGDAFALGKPRVWSEKRISFGGPMSGCDLAPDDKHLAVILYADGSIEQKPITHLTFLLNFSDYLKQRVPAGGG